MKRFFLAAICVLPTLCASQEAHQIAKIETGVSLRSSAVCQSGRKIVGVDTEGKLHIWDVASGRGALIELGEKAQGDIVCSPDGRRAALTLQDKNVAFVDLTTGKSLKKIHPTDRAVQGMAMDDGHLVAIASDASAPALYRDDADTNVELARPFGAAGAPAISPDGQLVATPDEDTNVRIYETNGKLRATVNCGPLEPFFAAFSPNGQMLYVVGADATVRTIDVASGKVVRSSQKLGTAALAMTVSGDKALVLMMDEYTMEPQTAAIWDAKTNVARKVAMEPKGFIAAGGTKNGWLLVKQEDKAMSLWELE